MPTTRTKVSVEDFEKDARAVAPFTVDALPADERDQANRAADAAKALFTKALLHRLSPGEFAVSAADSLEAQAVKAVAGLDAAVFDRMRPRLQAMRSDRAVLTRHVGATVADIDMTKPIGQALIAKKLVIKPVEPPQPVIKIASQGPKWGRAFFNLRKLHCVDETNPEGGADDMVLGGIMIGPAGGAKAIKSFVAGEFDDGDLQDYGTLPLGSVSLTVTPGYPKNVYCIILLVESDQDDKDAANAVSDICGLVATFAAAAGQGIAAAAFAAASGIIGVFAGLIEDDTFPPYGIQLRLNNALELGEDGVDMNRATYNIMGHGGAYRVGYRWELVA